MIVSLLLSDQLHYRMNPKNTVYTFCLLRQCLRTHLSYVHTHKHSHTDLYINDYPVFSSLLLINLILSAHFFIPCVFVSEVCAIWDCAVNTSLHEIVEEIAFATLWMLRYPLQMSAKKVSSFRTTPFGAFCICSWPSWLSRSQS